MPQTSSGGKGQTPETQVSPPPGHVMRQGLMLGCRSQTEGIWGRDISVNLSKYFYKTENMLESHCGQGIKLLKQHEKFFTGMLRRLTAHILARGALRFFQRQSLSAFTQNSVSTNTISSFFKAQFGLSRGYR